MNNTTTAASESQQNLSNSPIPVMDLLVGGSMPAGLSPACMLVYVHMAARGGPAGVAWPSQETVAKSMHLGLRTVKRAFSELSKRGLIERTGDSLVSGTLVHHVNVPVGKASPFKPVPVAKPKGPNRHDREGPNRHVGRGQSGTARVPIWHSPSSKEHRKNYKGPGRGNFQDSSTAPTPEYQHARAKWVATQEHLKERKLQAIAEEERNRTLRRSLDSTRGVDSAQEQVNRQGLASLLQVLEHQDNPLKRGSNEHRQAD